MKKIFTILLFTGFIALMAFKPRARNGITIPEGWPEPAYQLKRNELTPPKVELGRRLFYDPVLSRDSTISCASCHLQYTAFTHIDHALSHGIEGRIGTRNSPALMNLAWGSSFMWDGAVNHLDMQALAPISNKLEMDEDIAHVVKKLQATPDYPRLFYVAFRDSAITGEHVLKAISQFTLTLVSSNAKYDKVKRGESTFNEKEANGYRLFQQHCSVCHAEPLFTNGQFENNGLMVDTGLKDIGRMKITHKREDSLKFKVPTLRNIEYSAPFMHDGRFKTLNQVLNSYIMGVQQSPSLHPSLRNGIYLSSNEKVDVIAFLLTLTDSAFLHDPRFGFPKK